MIFYVFLDIFKMLSWVYLITRSFIRVSREWIKLRGVILFVPDRIEYAIILSWIYSLNTNELLVMPVAFFKSFVATEVSEVTAHYRVTIELDYGHGKLFEQRKII